MKENIKNIATHQIPILNGGWASILLHLADSALILSQRQSEWCGHGPMLEQDIAITNISLDLLGQARLWYQHAANSINTENKENKASEDTLAYLRNEREFKNFILCELPNGDWAFTILKLYFFTTYQQKLFAQLKNSSDLQVAAIAEKSLKETNYHVRWSREWILRLGDGTQESKQRLQNALNTLWQHTREFFELTIYENEAITTNIYFDPNNFKNEWLIQVKELFNEATITFDFTLPTGWTGLKGKEGIHTEQMGYILTDMQYLQRTYPNAEW